MKAKELMIGDWVRISHRNKIGKVYRVDETNGNGNGWAAVIDGDYHESDLEPIPLTSELLEKNGFERVPQPGCANPYHWMLEKYEEESDGLLFRIKAFNNPFRGMFVSIDNPSACETISFGKQIEFVHELQHALRICEIELDIKLEG